MDLKDIKIGQVVAAEPEDNDYVVWYNIYGVVSAIGVIGIGVSVPYKDDKLVPLRYDDAESCTDWRIHSYKPEELTLIRKHQCIYCLCGQVELEWSDRKAVLFPTVEGYTNVIVSWAVDHSYDRGSEFCSLPKNLQEVVQPIIEKHLSAINSNWREDTVVMTPDQKKVFREELKQVISQVINQKKEGCGQ